MKITDRIIQLLDKKEITKYKFCKDLGVSNGFLDKSREITTDKYANILAYFDDINPTWLLTGEGSMLRNSNVKKTEQTPVNTVGSEVQNTKCKQQIQLLQQENTLLKENINLLKENKVLVEEKITELKSAIQDKNQIIQLKDKEIAELQKKQLYATEYSIASEPEVEYNKR